MRGTRKKETRAPRTTGRENKRPVLATAKKVAAPVLRAAARPGRGEGRGDNRLGAAARS